jgi:hypothetical protein
MRQQTVWIVFTDAPDPPAVILGVFESAKTAAAFIEEQIQESPASSLLMGEYALGWTVNTGSSRYGTEPQ